VSLTEESLSSDAGEDGEEFIIDGRYFYSNSNYIVFQGAKTCYGIYGEDVNGVFGEQITESIPLDSINSSLDFDKEAIEGLGGYCIAFDIQDEMPVVLLDASLHFLGRGYSFKDFEIRFVAIEPSLNHYVLVDLTSTFEVAGQIKVHLEVQTFDLSVNETNFIIMGIFFILFTLNLYIFLNSEYNVWSRYAGWYEIKIKPMQAFEREQRDQ
jgi:hypothetical protein